VVRDGLAMIASDSEEIENDGGPALRTAVVVFAKR